MRRAAALLVALFMPHLAQAALFRAYLASWGDDTYPCTVTQPCRLLPTALANVASGGEIWMLDSANYNYGTVYISKSVTIQAVPGQMGSISSMANGRAVSINAAGIRVALRNVEIVNNALNPGYRGIEVWGGASDVTIEDSVMSGIVDYALSVWDGSRVWVKNTVIRNSTAGGIQVWDGATVSVSGCELLGNGYGAIAAATSTNAASGTVTQVQVSDSVMSGGADDAVWVVTGAAGTMTKVYITRSTIFGAWGALESRGPGALIELSGSMLVNNRYNLMRYDSGVLRIFGNNHIGDGSDIGIPVTVPLR